VVQANHALTIDPMKKIVKMLRSHRSLILNWFRVKELIALGAVESLNY
jgi:transposase